MFRFLLASQHLCYIIHILCDNWSASSYRSLADAGRRRALVCLDLLKQRRRVKHQHPDDTVAHPSSITTASLQYRIKGRQDYGTPEPRALVKEELLPSTPVPTQDFSDGTEFPLCLSDATVMLTCVSAENAIYLKELPELLPYIALEIKYSKSRFFLLNQIESSF